MQGSFTFILCTNWKYNLSPSLYVYPHTHTCVSYLGYMLLVDVLDVPASNQWNTLTHTLTNGVCMLLCLKDVEIWELQHTMDSYLLGVMIPLLRMNAPAFLTMWKGKMFLFTYACIYMLFLFFSEIRKTFSLPNKCYFFHGINPL